MLSPVCESLLAQGVGEKAPSCCKDMAKLETALTEGWKKENQFSNENKG